MRPIRPEDVDLIQAWIEEYLSQAHTSFPGRVNAYNASTQLADIVPLIRYPVRQPDESIEYEDLPVIPDCPVIWPRTAKWFLAMGLDVGDTVLVVVSELSFKQWLAGNGDLEYPGDQRRHHLANSYVVPGLFVQQKALAHAPAKLSDAGTSDPVLTLGCDDASGTRVSIGKDGSVQIAQGSNVRITVANGGAITIDAGSSDVNVKGGNVVMKSGTTPVAKEGSSTTGHLHTLTGTAGPYPLAGTAILTTDTIASGAGSPYVKVP